MLPEGNVVSDVQFVPLDFVDSQYKVSYSVAEGG